MPSKEWKRLPSSSSDAESEDEKEASQTVEVGAEPTDQIPPATVAKEPASPVDAAEGRHGPLPPGHSEKKGGRKIMQAAVFVGLWYLTSLGLSMYNKWMFGQGHKNFNFPLFTSSIHMVMQFILSYLSVIAVWPKLKPKKYPPIRDYFLRVLPCGVATGLDIGLSNSSLQTITLSFYTMVKSGAPVFVLLFAFWFGLEKPTWTLTGIIMLICFGVVLMVVHETNFRLDGYLQVQTATILSGFRWSITQILLERESIGMSNPFATSIFLAPVMGVCLLITSIVVERVPWALGSSPHFATLLESIKTLGWISLGGLIAFVMVISEFKLISTTSVVTFSIAGIFKEIVTIVASAIVFKDQFTATNIAGLIVSLIGIALYNYVRIVGLKGHGHHGQKQAHSAKGPRPPGSAESLANERPLFTLPRGSSETPSNLSGFEQQRGLLHAAEEFFDIDIEDDDYDDLNQNALYVARSGGVFGYAPVTSFISLERFRQNDETELSSFYPIGDIEEDDTPAQTDLARRENLI
ncbi:Triose-phosphate Transporter [Phlyctochytrium bullatum]|nr:Triose-phosphate Transporter [Phlyctochytrium bullatum]